MRPTILRLINIYGGSNSLDQRDNFYLQRRNWTEMALNSAKWESRRSWYRLLPVSPGDSSHQGKGGHQQNCFFLEFFPNGRSFWEFWPDLIAFWPSQLRMRRPPPPILLLVSPGNSSHQGKHWGVQKLTNGPVIKHWAFLIEEKWKTVHFIVSTRVVQRISIE